MTTALALEQLTLWAVSSADEWGAAPSTSALEYLLEHLPDPEDASRVPAMVGRLSFAAALDERGLSILGDLIVAHDLYEAADGLRPLAERGSADAVLLLAALAPHPGVAPDVYEVVTRSLGMLSDGERDLAETRLDPGHRPRTAAARVDRRSRWFPPRLSNADRLGIVAVHESAGPPLERLELVAELRRSGLLVRRYPEHPWKPEVGGWLPPWAVHVAADDIAAPRVVRTDGALTPARRREVLRVARKSFPAAIREVPFSPGREPRPPAGLEVMEVFDGGAIPSEEVGFFSGMARSAVYRASRHHRSLAPRSNGVYTWRFSQLVALRAANFLAVQAKGRGRRHAVGPIAARIVEESRELGEVPIGVTSEGRVVVERDGAVVDVRTGEAGFADVVRLADTVYAPIRLPKLRVPGLLRPSARTRLSPAVLHGLPFIESTRVPVSAVSDSLRAARAAGEPDPARAVLHDYPEVDVGAVREADQLASAIEAAK